jgi:hypothetical protein
MRPLLACDLAVLEIERFSISIIWPSSAILIDKGHRQQKTRRDEPREPTSFTVPWNLGTGG